MSQGEARIVPFLCVDDAAGAVEFYARAFGASEVARLVSDGKIDYAELHVGGATFRVCDEWPPAVLGPRSLGGTPVNLYLEVANVDEVVLQAVGWGATIVRDIADSPYGTRSGVLVDPFGHRWFVATKMENLSWQEKARRAATEGDVLTVAAG